MDRETKDAFLITRVTQTNRAKFIKKASTYGNPSDVLRELAEAFVEDRLLVKSPVMSKKEKLYVPRIQD